MAIEDLSIAQSPKKNCGDGRNKRHSAASVSGNARAGRIRLHGESVHRCLFRVPTIRSADFSGSAFKNCTFEPTRFASCKLANTSFDGVPVRCCSRRRLQL